ncbi:MAG: ABC transporter ATP-binding protein [Candidatus Improbicoccus pseudotrichonymphae]|uniref:ABC transporter ATP-binding protein n=1 Tax=Candidatus Improbicoccus pseudotrichonymphae TaxID=3033792 RepID=A0AA48KZC5_9FIRM|nr:MAG: ABC transporter ATP-binding protein [Candidatus Improbicoccus pseudotrichonymphae]
MKVIEFEDVSMIYRTLTKEILAIKNINLGINSGEFLTLIGPSGCGKSTIFLLILGLIRPTFGQIRIKGMAPDKHQYNIGCILQQDHLLPWRTIEQNAFLGLEIRKKLTYENKQFVLNLLKRYGLEKFLNFKPSQISGGMKQKVALIRTLAMNPEILLLDEPFSALDSQSKIKISDEIYEIVKKENKTAILITHDIQEAICMSDRIITLSGNPGKIKNVLKIRIERENYLQRIKNKKFNFYFETLWEGIEKNEKKL